MPLDNLNNSDLPVVLTIAASSCGGITGVQADLKTFSALRVFGVSAITCVTVQTPSEVRYVEPLSPEIVMQQIQAVSDAFPIAAAKTGVLYTADLIKVVAKADIAQGLPILVVDPVMELNSGARLLQADAVEALCNELLSVARVVTPNLHEAEIICGHTVSTVDEIQKAAEEIGNKYDVACVVKGGHLAGDEVVDVLFDEGETVLFRAKRIPAKETHGSGSAFSAALTGYLAHGEMMKDAVRLSIDFVRAALETAHKVGHHTPLNFFGN